MKKFKTLIILLILTLFCSFVACDNRKDGSENNVPKTDTHVSAEVNNAMENVEPAPTEEPGPTEEEKIAIAKEEYLAKAEADFNNIEVNVISYSVRPIDDSIAKTEFGLSRDSKGIDTSTEKVTALTIMYNETDTWIPGTFSFTRFLDINNFDDNYWKQYGIEVADYKMGEIEYNGKKYNLRFFLIPGEHSLEDIELEYIARNEPYYKCDALNGEEVNVRLSSEDGGTKMKMLSDMTEEITTLDYHCNHRYDTYNSIQLRSGDFGRYLLMLEEVNFWASSETGEKVSFVYRIYGLDGQNIKTDIAEIALRSNGHPMPDGITGYGEDNLNNRYFAYFTETISITHKEYNEEHIIPHYAGDEATIIDDWYDAFSIVLVTSSGECEFDVEPFWDKEYYTEE